MAWFWEDPAPKRPFLHGCSRVSQAPCEVMFDGNNIQDLPPPTQKMDKRGSWGGWFVVGVVIWEMVACFIVGRGTDVLFI